MTKKQTANVINTTDKIHPSDSITLNEVFNLLGKTNIGIFITDQNVDYLYINEQAAQILGYTLEELYKIPFVDLSPKDELINIAKRSLAMIAGKPKSDFFETEILKKDGTSLSILVTSSKINWKGNDARVAFFRDISKLKQLEREFQKINNEHSQMMNNQTYMIAKIDLDGQITHTNNSFNTFFNAAENELVGVSFNQLIYSDDQKLTRQTICALKHQPHSKAIRQRAITQEGIKWIEWLYTAILDENNNIKTIVVAIRDKSEIHALQERLEQSEKKYRDRFYNQLDPFNVASLDGKLIEYNKAFGKMAGFDPEKDYTGFDLSKTWPNQEDRVKLVNELIKKVMSRIISLNGIILKIKH